MRAVPRAWSWWTCSSGRLLTVSRAWPDGTTIHDQARPFRTGTDRRDTPDCGLNPECASAERCCPGWKPDCRMRVRLPAGGFLRHRGLILVAAGGAVAEAGLLTLVAPAARPIAPQVTALPALAAYHDLRWLFADSQSWLSFTGVLIGTLLLRSAMDAVLLRLARPGPHQAPRFSRAFWSCFALTALAWVLLSPVVTLAFGVAVLPFSWPFIAAL